MGKIKILDKSTSYILFLLITSCVDSEDPRVKYICPICYDVFLPDVYGRAMVSFG